MGGQHMPGFKRWKQILFIVTSVSFTPIYILWNLFLWIPAFLFACNEVLDNLLSRYEHWAYSVPKDYFYNSPYKQTLKEVFEEALTR